MHDLYLKLAVEESKRQTKRDQDRRDAKDADALNKGLQQSKAQAAGDPLLQLAQEESRKQLQEDQDRRDAKDADALKKGLEQSTAHAAKADILQTEEYMVASAIALSTQFCRDKRDEFPGPEMSTSEIELQFLADERELQRLLDEPYEKKTESDEVYNHKYAALQARIQALRRA